MREERHTVCVCVCACVRACMRACVCACVHAHDEMNVSLSFVSALGSYEMGCQNYK